MPAGLSIEETNGVVLRLPWLLDDPSFLASAGASRLNMAVSLAARRWCMAECNIL